MSFRRPTLAISLVTLVALAILIGLGTWQLQRLHWKTDLLARIAAHRDAAPVPLPADIADLADWDYRPVTVTGHFLDPQMPLAGRQHAGALGYQLVVPLERADGTGFVLVNRGWVPVDKLDPATRPDPAAAGEVMVTGLARVPPEPGWLAPANQPERNLWYSVDIAAMAAHAYLSRTAPVVVEAGPTPEGDLPIGGQTVVNIPNNHLQYVFTWYAFAVVLAGIFIAYHWRRP